MGMGEGGGRGACRLFVLGLRTLSCLLNPNKLATEALLASKVDPVVLEATDDESLDVLQLNGVLLMIIRSMSSMQSPSLFVSSAWTEILLVRDFLMASRAI